MIVNLALSPAPIVTGIGACIVDALAQTPAGAPGRQCLLLPTFQIPWDNCDCDGQIALAIQSVYGSDTFPAPFVRDWHQCGPHWQVVQAVVSVTRCVPTMDDQAVPPPCPDEQVAAVTLENDRTAVRQALVCCLTELKAATPPRIGSWALQPSITVGESGACAGVETVFLFSVPSPCLCG